MLSRDFFDRMKALLGESYEEFSAALEDDAVKGVRANGIKISPERLVEASSLTLEPLAHVGDGFIPREQSGLGLTPEHHAGMIYVQDPGAMATVGAIDVQEGWWVMDTCAAPGGKSAQLAAAVGESGFLLSNEYVPKRAKILVSNLERMGARNSMVVSLDTAMLGKMYEGIFDLVLCDAPCSGEGMLRKYSEASEEWSEENVLACAVRQREILNNIAGTVKPGGYLLYSTCTYSTEENEETVTDFLRAHPDYRIVPVKGELDAVTEEGISVPDAPEEIKHTRRFYPHLSRGEGQYIALLKRDENADILQRIIYKDASISPTKEEIRITEKFIFDNFTSPIKARLIKHGGYIAAVPHGCPIPERSVFMPGVILGEISKGNFFPHHQMFSAYGSLMKRRENLRMGDARVEKYLRGEEIAAVEIKDSGWCTVCYEGVSLGGGKASGGRIKNHYPKGLRNK